MSYVFLTYTPTFSPVHFGNNIFGNGRMGEDVAMGDVKQFSATTDHGVFAKQQSHAVSIGTHGSMVSVISLGNKREPTVVIALLLSIVLCRTWTCNHWIRLVVYR